MSINYLTSDYEKVEYLVNLLTAHATGKEAEDIDYIALRKELLKKSYITEKLPTWIRTNRNLGSFWGFIQPKFGTYAERRKFIQEEFSEILNLLEFGETVESIHPIDFDALIAAAPDLTPTQPIKQKIFVVHGRDNEAKLEISRYIESLGIEAIILHEQASSGRTIIEKIEYYSDQVDFAVVLYTACDHGRGIHEKKVHPRNRARQNVVFEHGYLMAKLGRENVCALVKGEIETPNDISGVVYVEMDQAGAWKSVLLKELHTCGYLT